jgi:hypothetical protein
MVMALNIVELLAGWGHLQVVSHVLTSVAQSDNILSSLDAPGHSQPTIDGHEPEGASLAAETARKAINAEFTDKVASASAGGGAVDAALVPDPLQQGLGVGEGGGSSFITVPPPTGIQEERRQKGEGNRKLRALPSLLLGCLKACVGEPVVRG